MKAYIRSASAISPQHTFGQTDFLKEAVEYQSNRLICIEPDYHAVIDAKLGRRMSRIIKMGVASALTCLKQANVQPDAIITGTAYGCLEDTGTFLTNMVEMDEEPITPTAFVQSTHNTIGAQVALLTKCHGYNNTFVSGSISFELALQDAMMLLAERPNSTVLVGGMDEITNASHQVLTRFGIYKKEPVNNLEIFKTNTKGTINGEGAAFFLLTDQPSADNLACLEAVETFYKPDSPADALASFLRSRNIDLKNIDLIISGKNGDAQADAEHDELIRTAFADIPLVNYKHLCGDYPTASSFAMWVAANIIKLQTVPEILGPWIQTDKAIQRILICHQDISGYHSLMLLSAC